MSGGAAIQETHGTGVGTITVVQLLNHVQLLAAPETAAH